VRFDVFIVVTVTFRALNVWRAALPVMGLFRVFDQVVQIFGVFVRIVSLLRDLCQFALEFFAFG
jgi:hypothetical protein